MNQETSLEIAVMGGILAAAVFVVLIGAFFIHRRSKIKDILEEFRERDVVAES